MTEPLRAAIVGAGPSGFYAAGQLLAVDEPSFAVDLYDRLPTPYGLVRSGVAPDHPKIKSVTRAYDKTTEHERFRFFGHVELGGDITRRQLLEHYHVVLYTLGTSIDRRLGIPGEELRGSHAATEFVAWYNGHPDHSGLEVDLQGKHAVVIGAGNVAIDVARMLALAPSELAGTDTADHAIEVLAASGIEDITILARRGPLQAAFTNPELLEMGELERGDVEIVGGELDDLSAVALGRGRQDPAAERRDPAVLRGAAEDRKADHRPFPLPRLSGRAARRRARPRACREDREQRDRGARRRLAGRARYRHVRRAPGTARVPLDRLHGVSRSTTSRSTSGAA